MLAVAELLISSNLEYVCKCWHSFVAGVRGSVLYSGRVGVPVFICNENM